MRVAWRAPAAPVTAGRLRGELGLRKRIAHDHRPATGCSGGGFRKSLACDPTRAARVAALARGSPLAPAGGRVARAPAARQQPPASGKRAVGSDRSPAMRVGPCLSGCAAACDRADGASLAGFRPVRPRRGMGRTAGAAVHAGLGASRVLERSTGRPRAALRRRDQRQSGGDVEPPHGVARLRRHLLARVPIVPPKRPSPPGPGRSRDRGAALCRLRPPRLLRVRQRRRHEHLRQPRFPTRPMQA
jgi:hypothetical protein